MRADGQSALCRVVPVGAVSTAALVWRTRGELQLTVIVQARLAMQHERMMLLIEPRPLLGRDVHRDDDPTKSLLAAADVVPFRPRVDVWLTGHACAPGGRPLRVGLVRLAVYRHSERLLDKLVHVHGDRAAPGDAPAPFERIPLTYERAYGGAGFDANPVGVGADDRPIAPNLLHPERPEQPACYAPISRYWKARRQHITSEQRRDLERPVAEVAASFDWRYYQAAPADQQLDKLNGDEWLVLDGIDPTLLRLQTRLPRIRGVARLVGDGELGDEVALEADTLAIDADGKEASITWRGIVRIGSKDELAALRIAAGVAHGGGTIDWSDALRGAFDEPTLLDSLSPRALGDLRHETTLVSAQDMTRTSIDGAGEDARPDELLRTSLDRTSVEHLAPAARLDGELEPTLRSRVTPRFPRGAPDDEVTDTETGLEIRGAPEARSQIDTLPGTMPELRPHEDTLPGVMPDGLPTWDDLAEVDDTLVGRMSDLDDLTEAPPAVAPRRLPPRPRKRAPQGPSVVPPPLDRAAHAAALRQAGASEEDIAAALDDESVPSR